MEPKPPMTLLQWLKLWDFLPATEARQKGQGIFASNSEKRRWIERGSVEIDGEKATINDIAPFPWERVVLHPNGVRRTTLQ
jgi:hypothetical protein